MVNVLICRVSFILIFSYSNTTHPVEAVLHIDTYICIYILLYIFMCVFLVFSFFF